MTKVVEVIRSAPVVVQVVGGARGLPGTPITVSATAPVSPNVGDLWVDTSS